MNWRNDGAKAYLNPKLAGKKCGVVSSAATWMVEISNVASLKLEDTFDLGYTQEHVAAA
ncbi:hypothetical protein OH492_26360 [Vibrio chagasii]|nr:hypothetical protein [Vibrio chagasii]